jgi:hypothetical protein
LSKSILLVGFVLIVLPAHAGTITISGKSNESFSNTLAGSPTYTVTSSFGITSQGWTNLAGGTGSVASPQGGLFLTDTINFSLGTYTIVNTGGISGTVNSALLTLSSNTNVRTATCTGCPNQSHGFLALEPRRSAELDQ